MPSDLIHRRGNPTKLPVFRQMTSWDTPKAHMSRAIATSMITTNASKASYNNTYTSIWIAITLRLLPVSILFLPLSGHKVLPFFKVFDSNQHKGTTRKGKERTNHVPTLQPPLYLTPWRQARQRADSQEGRLWNRILYKLVSLWWTNVIRDLKYSDNPTCVPPWIQRSDAGSFFWHQNTNQGIS